MTRNTPKRKAIQAAKRKAAADLANRQNRHWRPIKDNPAINGPQLAAVVASMMFHAAERNQP